MLSRRVKLGDKMMSDCIPAELFCSAKHTSAAAAMSPNGCLIVVKAGYVKEASVMSSKPTTDRSAGI